MALSRRQKDFAAEYVRNGGNIMQAAIKAGYTEKTADKQGYKILGALGMADYIAQLQAKTELAAGHNVMSLAEIQERRSLIASGNAKDSFGFAPDFSDQLKAMADLEKALKIKQDVEDRKAAEEAAKRAKTYHMDLYDVADVFHPMIRDIRDKKHSEYILPGGRGSTKSSVAGNIIVEYIKNNYMVHALVLRKVGNTLRDSVYSQIKWAVNKQGLENEFEFKVSPMEITYKPTGQKIFFRGADDPLKIKSIKPEFGYIGLIWFEELDQFSGPEEIRNIEQSAIRGGDDAIKIKSFNPPKSKNNWANEYTSEREYEENSTAMVVRSTYKDVPPEWLGKQFIADAEHLKRVNPKAYANEYGGEANGTGGNVFEFLELRKITDEEISRMDTIYQGVDWGWYPDAYAFIRAYYDKRTEKIYLIDENYVHKTSNEITGKWIKDKGYTDYVITCDSNENKSINDYRDQGIMARPAVKGPGSVEYGFKWLQCRTIVIDKSRTPNAEREITKYEYDRDKDGNIITGYPDGQDDHIIAALRYAFESLHNRRGYSA